MKHRYALTGFLLLAIAAPAFAQPERDEDRQRAEAFFARADAAMNSGHMSNYFTMLGPDYYFVDSMGNRMDLPEVKNRMVGMVAGRGVHMHTAVKNVQLQNGEMVIWIEQQLSFKAKRNGRWVMMYHTGRFADGIAQTANGWAITSTQQLMTDEPWSFKTNGG